jgi:hypothetical protein
MMRRNAHGNLSETTETLDESAIFDRISETSTRHRDARLTAEPTRAARFAMNGREEDKGRMHVDEHAGAVSVRRRQIVEERFDE